MLNVVPFQKARKEEKIQDKITATLLIAAQNVKFTYV